MPWKRLDGEEKEDGDEMGRRVGRRMGRRMGRRVERRMGRRWGGGWGGGGQIGMIWWRPFIETCIPGTVLGFLVPVLHQRQLSLRKVSNLPANYTTGKR